MKPSAALCLTLTLTAGLALADGPEAAMNRFN